MKKSARGFTLIELLVVITIIAVLAVIGITVFSGVQTNARNARRQGDIEAIAKALEVHFVTSENPTLCAGAVVGTYCPVLSSWFASNAIPLDPGTGLSYEGMPSGSGHPATFTVCAVLEPATTPLTKFCRSNQQ